MSTVADESLVPFASMLSSFTLLTELEWVHHPKPQSIPEAQLGIPMPQLGSTATPCAYAEALGESLKQMEGLQALSINTGVSPLCLCTACICTSRFVHFIHICDVCTLAAV